MVSKVVRDTMFGGITGVGIGEIHEYQTNDDEYYREMVLYADINAPITVYTRVHYNGQIYNSIW